MANEFRLTRAQKLELCRLNAFIKNGDKDSTQLYRWIESLVESETEKA